jgi:hypothetical protein
MRQYFWRTTKEIHMAKALATLMISGLTVLTLAGAAFAQSCDDIHSTLTNDGCSPSDLDGQPVTVTGVVYVVAGTYNSGSVYFQCGAGGMTFFESAAPYAEGDEIEVMGTVGSFNEEIQLNGAVVTVNSSGNSTSPNFFSTGVLAAGGSFLGDFIEVEATLVLGFRWLQRLVHPQ